MLSASDHVGRSFLARVWRIGTIVAPSSLEVTED